jgi:uncharacterized protein involved in cysteine biosynthesis
MNPELYFTPWPTEKLLLALLALVLVLSAVAYISSRFAKALLEKPEPRDLPTEAKQLREVAARAYRAQIRRVR